MFWLNCPTKLFPAATFPARRASVLPFPEPGSRKTVSLSVSCSSVFLAFCWLQIFLLLIVGASLILWLISRTKFFDFKSFGEAYQFSLNCLGLPTLLACLFGLFQQPIQTVILVQNTVFALVLVWVFYKTRFRDAA